MQSEITHIRFTERTGAYGNPNAHYVAVYGKRPDGRTVQCECHGIATGGVRISSSYLLSGESEFRHCATELTEQEWNFFQAMPSRRQKSFTTEWLESRAENEFSAFQLDLFAAWKQGAGAFRAALHEWGVIDDQE